MYIWSQTSRNSLFVADFFKWLIFDWSLFTVQKAALKYKVQWQRSFCVMMVTSFGQILHFLKVPVKSMCDTSHLMIRLAISSLDLWHTTLHQKSYNQSITPLINIGEQFCLCAHDAATYWKAWKFNGQAFHSHKSDIISAGKFWKQ